MNVSSKWVPLATTAHGFMIIIGVIVVICVLILILLKKENIVIYCVFIKRPQYFIENNEILRLILFLELISRYFQSVRLHHKAARVRLKKPGDQFRLRLLYHQTF